MNHSGLRDLFEDAPFSGSHWPEGFRKTPQAVVISKQASKNVHMGASNNRAMFLAVSSRKNPGRNDAFSWSHSRVRWTPPTWLCVPRVDLWTPLRRSLLASSFLAPVQGRHPRTSTCFPQRCMCHLRADYSFSYRSRLARSLVPVVYRCFAPLCVSIQLLWFSESAPCPYYFTRPCVTF